MQMGKKGSIKLKNGKPFFFFFGRKKIEPPFGDSLIMSITLEEYLADLQEPEV